MVNSLEISGVFSSVHVCPDKYRAMGLCARVLHGTFRKSNRLRQASCRVKLFVCGNVNICIGDSVRFSAEAFGGAAGG